MQPQPMQPMQPPKKELPSYLKVVLGLKGLGCLAVLGLTLIGLSAMSSGVDWPALTDESRAGLHFMSRLFMWLMGVELVELLGIAGTWTFKRWGVYILGGFSMLDVVLNLRLESSFGITIGLVTTLVAGFGIATRWGDFD